MKKNHQGTLLALDQASQITGWAIFKNGYLKDSGIWKFRKINDESNYFGLFDKINETIKKHHITEIAAEEIYKDDRKLSAYGVLAGCKAIVIAASQLNDIPLFFIEAKWVQIDLIGSHSVYRKLSDEEKRQRRAKQKERLKTHVEKLGYTLNSGKDDESDAIAIAIYNLNRQRGFKVHYPVDEK